MNDGLHSNTYDAENNLLPVDGGSTALYQYGALNERLFGAWNNQYQRWGVDLYNRRSTSFFNGSLSVNEVQFYAGSQKHAYWLNTDNNFHFESTDWLGTVRLRTSAYGTVEGSYGSLPFGDGFTESGSDDNLLHYTGFDADVAPSEGLGHATYREYGNVAGRWTSPDPYTGSYDFTDPQSLNRYVYAQNNPLSNVDPLGYSSEDGTSDGGGYRSADGCVHSGGGGIPEGLGDSHGGSGTLGQYFMADLGAILGGLPPAEFGEAQLPPYVTDTLEKQMNELAAAGFAGSALNKGPKPNTGACLAAGIQSFFGGDASITGIVGETGGHWNFDITLTLPSAKSVASFQTLYDEGCRGFGPPARFDPGPAIHFENVSVPAPGGSGTYIVSGTSHIDLYNPNTGFVGIAGHSAVDYVGGHVVQLMGGNIDPSSCPF